MLRVLPMDLKPILRALNTVSDVFFVALLVLMAFAASDPVTVMPGGAVDESVVLRER